MFFIVAALVYLSLYLVHGVYVLATIAAARVSGIVVESAEFGFGPRLLKVTWQGVAWELRPLILNSCVRMLGMGDSPAGSEFPPGSYAGASAPARMFVVLAGPVAMALAGVALLLAPLLLETPQLSARYTSAESIEPRAVPLLYQHQEAAHWRGQFDLWQDTGLEYALRLLTFRPLPGYGGYLGFMATTSAAALRSPGNFLTLLGLFALTSGLANLLPFPTQGGGRACIALWEGVTRRRLSEKFETYLLLIGSIPVWLIFLRLIWLDLSWLI